VVDWSGGVFASCMPRVQLYVNACSGWPQFALQHQWLLPINCHFLRLYSAAGRGIAAVSSAIEESDLYLFYLYVMHLCNLPLNTVHSEISCYACASTTTLRIIIIIIIIIIIMSLLSSDKTHMPPYTERRINNNTRKIV